MNSPASAAVFSTLPFHPTHVVVGAGSAGCVMASRLSEDPENRVLLLEAGTDHGVDQVPPDIANTYAGLAFNNPAYFWPELKMQRPGVGGVRYEQARVIGGGSSINGQVALRGAPRDYDMWEQMGAAGWNWSNVLPYFRKLEHDRNFDGPLHGKGGPIPIDRIQSSHWDALTRAVTQAWAAQGFAHRADMNGTFEEGFAEIPLANDGKRRVSAAVGYLGAEVRRRPNLVIWADAEVERIVMNGRRAQALDVRGRGRVDLSAGSALILCAGAIHSPWLLMRAGVGAAAHLLSRGIQPCLDLPGVGSNLQDHPSISLSAYLPSTVRRLPILRHNYVNLIYSSKLPDCPPGDMVMMVVVKSAWHAVGQRLGTLSAYVGKAYSAGHVRLAATDPHGSPEVDFNWLADGRDLQRAVASFRYMAALLATGEIPRVALDPFTVGFSDKIKKLGRITWRNRLLTELAARAMDSSAFIRRQIISRFVTGGLTIDDLLRDDAALTAYVQRAVTGIWHPCGTCRMGRPDDPLAVTDWRGKVHGSENLYVADASVMPEIPTTNLNIPTIMVAERIADLMRSRQRIAVVANMTNGESI
jgi:5-(hydroxymethyl)furfural/furfural oxidase